MKLPWSLSRHPRLGDWIRITPNHVLVRTGKVELGQGISTAVAMIAAEELDLPVNQIRVQTGSTSQTPDEQMTTGSMSIEMSGASLRQAAAEVRAELLRRAAERFSVDITELVVESGIVRHQQSNRFATFYELVPEQELDLEANGESKPKAAKDYKLVGRTTTRLDLEAKITGKPAYVQDVAESDPLHARSVRGRVPGGKLISVDTSVVSALDCQVHIDGSFIGVVSSSEHVVIEARARLRAAAEWQQPDKLPRDLYQFLVDEADHGLHVVDGTPVEGELPPQKQCQLTATYKKPYYLHGSIGPSAATALYDNDVLKVRSHSQGPFVLRKGLSDVLGIPEDNVDVEHAENAGCYGHNGADDAAMDAAMLAVAFPGRRVLLKWEREDEHLYEPFSPAMVMQMGASLDAAGVTLWNMDIYSQTHVARPRPQPGKSGFIAAWEKSDPIPRPAPQPAMFNHVGIHRNADPYYGFDDKRIIKHLVRDTRIRTSATRGLGAFGNVFAIESFMDELAHAASIDPVAFRLAHLDDDRAAAVIEQAASMLSSPTGSVGIAFARYKNAQAYAAVAVDVSVNQETFDIRLNRAAIAADAGLVIDADGLANQLEGGFIQAASSTLKEAVSFDEFASVCTDWDSYPILRFSEVPPVDVQVIDQPQARSLGAGEATQGPTPAAIANAIFVETGLRIRELPITPDRLKQTALEA